MPRRTPHPVPDRDPLRDRGGPGGYLYVVDDPDRRVHKLDGQGRILASFGRGCGEDEGQLFARIGLAVDKSGRAYVADWFRGAVRVHVFAPDSGLLGTWSVGDAGQLLRLLQGIAVDAQGGSTWRTVLLTITRFASWSSVTGGPPRCRPTAAAATTIFATVVRSAPVPRAMAAGRPDCTGGARLPKFDHAQLPIGHGSLPRGRRPRPSSGPGPGGGGKV